MVQRCYQIKLSGMVDFSTPLLACEEKDSCIVFVLYLEGRLILLLPLYG